MPKSSDTSLSPAASVRDAALNADEFFSRPLRSLVVANHFFG